MQRMHVNENNKNGFKALIAAEYVGVEVDVIGGFEFGVTNKTEEFLKLNPFGKVIIISEDLFLYS